jgi:phosphoribosylaminoimidazole (AIR) synthetase
MMAEAMAKRCSMRRSFTCLSSKPRSARTSTCHYAAHITGHGWRKLMRLDEPFVYRITEMRDPPAIFRMFLNSSSLDHARGLRDI